jgi:NADPH:quinone reductase-like Zn-dependent oxidoreductase
LTVHWGATIVACTSSAAKGERLKALGADRVINTSEQDFVAATFELRQAVAPRRRCPQGRRRDD